MHAGDYDGNYDEPLLEVTNQQCGVTQPNFGQNHHKIVWAAVGTSQTNTDFPSTSPPQIANYPLNRIYRIFATLPLSSHCVQTINNKSTMVGRMPERMCEHDGQTN